MAENLRYLPEVTPSSVSSSTEPHSYVQGYYGIDPVRAKKSALFKEYGVLYNQSAAMISCPDGWHLPTDTEWEQLANFINDTERTIRYQNNDVFSEIILPF